MKITQITIDSVLGVKALDTALHTPVTVIAGDNAAGKSSIREAIKAAFLGMPERVLKKKDFDQLVHDGQKAGTVAITFDGGEATFIAPKGEQDLRHSLTMDAWERQALALPYCLDINAFAQATNDERRQLLFAITGATAKASDIVASLKERGLSEQIIETVTPLLRTGFPAAAKFAEEHCRDSKSAWRTITGEAYGSVKAQTWEAAVPEVDTTAIEQLTEKAETLKAKIGTEQTRLGAAEQKLKNWLAHNENAEADRKAFARLANLEKKLEHDTDDLTKWQDQVKILEGQAGTGPRVGLVHDLAAWLLVAIEYIQQNAPGLECINDIEKSIAAYESQYGEIGTEGDPEAAAKLPEAIKARDLMQRTVENTKRDIDAAKAAGARLGQQVEKGSKEEVDSVRTILAGYQQELKEATAELQKLQADQQAAAAAQDKTDKAKQAHENAQAWQLAIDALSPSGIPAEILGKALAPVNQIMAKLASTFDWPSVHIDSDMMITAGYRAYALLSESEKWRTNAIIALTLANISGLRFVALDQFDILSLSARADFIDGIDVLATDDFIDTALVFGTFKKLPNFEKFPHVSGFWIDGGMIDGKQNQKVAA